ncbi:MAG: T9SS type A sorting domain-containing protein [Chitinophagaceae bacterium]|nr:T9SS type A sorting domain-containing protein [Chitinophagaceae bacterium]
MRTLFAICASLMFSSPGIAANITAKQNGDWTSALTWDLNRTPVNNDVVFIPVGISVRIVSSPYPKNDPAARPTLTLNILGTLDFSDPGNDKFYLDIGSVIQVYPEGKILTTNNNPEIIAIYNGSYDNTVWSGDPNIIRGPAIANSGSLGFLNMVLSQNHVIERTTLRAPKYNSTISSSLIFNSYTRALHFKPEQFLNNQEISISVFDLNGNLIFQNKLRATNQVLSLPVISTGIFIIQLKGDRGFILSKKIVIRR